MAGESNAVELAVTINPPEGEETLYCVDNLNYYQGALDDDYYRYTITEDDIDETHAVFTIVGNFSGESTIYLTIEDPDNDDEVLASVEIPVTITQTPATAIAWQSASITTENNKTGFNTIVPTPEDGGVDGIEVTSSDTSLVEVEMGDEMRYGKYRWKYTTKGVTTGDPVTITATCGELTATFTMTINAY